MENPTIDKMGIVFVNMKNIISTKDRLADAFLTCLEDTNYTKIKASTVARMCAVDRQTFYYWFKDTEDVLRYLLHREFHPDPAEGFWPDDLEEGRALFLELAEAKRTLLNTLLASPVRNEGIMAWYHLMVRGFAQRFDAKIQLISNNKLRESIQSSKDYFAMSMSIATISSDECWIRGGMFEVTKENLIRMELQVADDCLKGIIARHKEM